MQHRHISRNSKNLVSAFAVILTLGTATAQAEATHAPKIVPPDRTIHGLSYSEWGAAWWQWAISVPASVNPVVDATGADAAQGQSGPVWFLAGTFDAESSERTIEIPRGKWVFFPIVNSFANNQFCSEPDYDFSVDGLADYVDWVEDSAANLFVELDGELVTDLAPYRAATGAEGAFEVTVPGDNVYAELFDCSDVTAGTWGPNVADGYWIMLKPLKKGEHTIRFGGDLLLVGATQDNTYHITVP